MGRFYWSSIWHWDQRVCPRSPRWNSTKVSGQREHYVDMTSVLFPLSNSDNHSLIWSDNRKHCFHFHRRHWARYYRTPKYFSDQLHFRYLLAIEGNDVASGLKWMLASKSAVMMVPPRRETWALESQLQAWVHFIPLEPDFSDLLDKIEFCESQLQVCEPISRYSTDFMRYLYLAYWLVFVSCFVSMSFHPYFHLFSLPPTTPNRPSIACIGTLKIKQEVMTKALSDWRSTWTR